MSERRNNADRIGAPHPDAEAPPTATTPTRQTNNEFLSFVAPTEFIDLPSGGTLYPEGHTLAGVTQIEIRHMTAKEEDILTSESLIRKGVAIDRLLSSLLVDKTVKLDQMLVGDKNALLVGARVTGFGSEYKTNVTCPLCDTTEENTFDLDLIENTTTSEIPEGVTATDHHTYCLTLPLTNVEIELKMMTSGDERKFLETTQRKKRSKQPASMSTDMIKTIVVAVGGRREKPVIAQFINRMPVKDSRHLRTVYEQIVPNIDLTQDYFCDACGYEGRIDVPLTAEFFWPKS